jgi:hypothetical protein
LRAFHGIKFTLEVGLKYTVLAQREADGRASIEK